MRFYETNKEDAHRIVLENFSGLTDYTIYWNQVIDENRLYIIKDEITCNYCVVSNAGDGKWGDLPDWAEIRTIIHDPTREAESNPNAGGR